MQGIGRVLIMEASGALDHKFSALKPLKGTIYMRAKSPDALAEMLSDELFDLLVLDLDLCDGNFVPVFRTIASEGNSVPVIAVTETPQTIEDAISATAIAYSVSLLGLFSYDFDPHEVMAILPNLSGDGLSVGISHVLSVDEFARGIAGDGLTPIYQPKVSLETGRIDRVESYARWRSPLGSHIGAAAVLDLARRGGHMAMLTQRMVESALAALQDWREAGLQLEVAVNVDAESLESQNFVEDLIDLIGQSRGPAGVIRLEVTRIENHISVARLNRSLAALKAAGFKLSYDDFTNGLNGIIRLDAGLFDDVVMNRYFLSRATAEGHAHTLIKASVGALVSEGMSVNIQGVESAADHSVAKALGVTHAQGFFFGVPMYADAIIGHCRSFDMGRLAT